MMNLHAFSFKSSFWAGALLTAVTATSALDARAQTQSTCITLPASVPGLSGPPNWFGPPASTNPPNPTGSRPELDDPRWAGAPLMPFASGLPGAFPTYRILRTENALFLSFHAPIASSGTDVVYFAFSEGVGTPDPDATNAYIVAVSPAPASNGADPIPSNAFAVVYKYVQADNPQWRAIATPAWLTQVATWRSPDTGLAFGVNFKISFKLPGAPAGSTVALPTSANFHAFFGMGLGLDPVGLVEYSTPAIAPTATDFALSGMRVPRLHSQWATFSGVGTSCREGVTLDTHNIRTGHPDGHSLYTGVPFSQNTFTISPQSIRGTAVPIEDNAVRVQLSLAEWGALVPDASAPWTPIAGTEGGDMSSGTWLWTWNTVDGNSPGQGLLTSANIDFTCAIQGSDTYCPLLTLPGGTPPSGLVDEVLLAELIPDPQYANSGGLRFRRPSAIQNMIFITLSEDQRAATISMRGAPKHKDPKVTERAVYLKVVRRNMPAHGNERLALPIADMRRVRRFVRNPFPSPIEIPDEPPRAGTTSEGAMRGSVKDSAAQNPPMAGVAPQPEPPQPEPQPLPKPQQPKAIDGQSDPKLPEVLPLEYSSATHHELMSRVWPVYEVHGFYETGETVNVNGKVRKVMRPLMPFGYLLNHDGPYYGFTDAIVGIDGATLTQVAPDLYRVSVPHDGKVRIKTTIRAEEEPKKAESPRGCHLRAPGGAAVAPQLLPLSLLPIALFFWRRKRRANG
jgi:hypothetical protein